jgi:hypothetical protein
MSKKKYNQDVIIILLLTIFAVTPVVIYLFTIWLLKYLLII